MSVKADELFTICSTTLHPFDIHNCVSLCIKSAKRRLVSTGTGGLADKGVVFAPFRKDRSDRETGAWNWMRSKVQSACSLNQRFKSLLQVNGSNLDQ